MLGAVVAQVVVDQRGFGHDLVAVRVLAVEGAQRVDLGALEAVPAHLVLVVEDELANLLAVGGAAGTVAHRVDVELELGGIEAEPLEVLHEHDDALGVGRGVGSAQPLDTHLVELAQATLLGALSAKHCLGVPELGRRAALRDEIVLDGGADHARGALGTHGHALARLQAGLGALLEEVAEQRAGDHAEHLLANDIGRLTDAMDEGVDLLDGGGLDHIEAVRAKQLARHVLHVLPRAHVSAVQILGSLNLLSHKTRPFGLQRSPLQASISNRLVYLLPPPGPPAQTPRPSLWRSYKEAPRNGATNLLSLQTLE